MFVSLWEVNHKIACVSASASMVTLEAVTLKLLLKTTDMGRHGLRGEKSTTTVDVRDQNAHCADQSHGMKSNHR